MYYIMIHMGTVAFKEYDQEFLKVWKWKLKCDLLIVAF